MSIWHEKILLILLVGILLPACSGEGYGGCDRFTGECIEPDYDEIELPSEEFDQWDDKDCVDIGEEIWVGDDDPHGLDADGDGWGCESWP